MDSGTETRSEVGEAERERGAVERIVLFSDAVIAIVITLMVLEVKPPHAGEHAPLLPALLALWPEFLAVALSFAVIALFWVRHHRLFQWVERQDGGLIWINLALLLSIAAIPFCTAVLAHHSGTAGTVLYALSIAVTAGLLTALWAYAGLRTGIAPGMPVAERRSSIGSGLATMAIFALSAPLAVWAPDSAKLLWLLVIVVTAARRTAGRAEPEVA